MFKLRNYFKLQGICNLFIIHIEYIWISCIVWKYENVLVQILRLILSIASQRIVYSILFSICFHSVDIILIECLTLAETSPTSKHSSNQIRFCTMCIGSFYFKVIPFHYFLKWIRPNLIINIIDNYCSIMIDYLETIYAGFHCGNIDSSFNRFRNITETKRRIFFRLTK